MKLYRLLLVGLIAIVALSCETETQIDIGPRGIASATIDAVVAIFQYDDIENAAVVLDIDINDKSAKETRLYGQYNGEGEKVLLKTITAYPSTVEITSQEFAAAFDKEVKDLEKGESLLITTESVDASGEIWTNANSLNAAVACAFDPAFVSGTYSVVTEEWGSTGTVTITPVEGDPYKFEVVGLAAMDGVDEDLGPLVFEVNPLDFSVVAPKVALATKAFGYDMYSYESASPGVLNTCDGSYRMAFTITVTQGSFGTFNDFVFTKK